MMMALAPAENLVAVADAPPTSTGAQGGIRLRRDLLPFSDVVVADPYQGIADGLKVAFYIGQSKVVGGSTTDMVAFVNDNVLVQVWIGADDKLPRMLRAIYSDDPQHLRHQMELTNWKLEPTLAADALRPRRPPRHEDPVRGAERSRAGLEAAGQGQAAAKAQPAPKW